MRLATMTFRLALCAALFGFAANAHAASKFYGPNGVDGRWDDPANWTGGDGLPPTAAENAWFDARPSTALIDSATTAVANRLALASVGTSALRTINMTGGTLDTTLLDVGVTGWALMNVSGGTVTYDHAVCATCESKICVEQCVPQILTLNEEGCPVLRIPPEEAKKGRCTECLACDVDCTFQGAGGGTVELPIPGLDEYRRRQG